MALTVGVGTVMEAREVLVIISGAWVGGYWLASYVVGRGGVWVWIESS